MLYTSERCVRILTGVLSNTCAAVQSDRPWGANLVWFFICKMRMKRYVIDRFVMRVKEASKS